MEGSKQQNTTKELEMSQKEKTKQISTISFRSRDLEVMGLARFPCAIVLWWKHSLCAYVACNTPFRIPFWSKLNLGEEDWRLGQIISVLARKVGSWTWILAAQWVPSSQAFWAAWVCQAVPLLATFRRRLKDFVVVSPVKKSIISPRCGPGRTCQLTNSLCLSWKYSAD